jgi:NAD-dependent deacetylase
METKKFKQVVAFTGAGISKASGIPTFKDTPGLKEKLSSWYRENYPKDFNKAYDDMKNVMKDKEPNDAHYALAEYDIPIITMNVDGLHQKAGSKIVYDIHGDVEKDNVVLYGQNVHHFEECFELLNNYSFGGPTAFLVIGTSLETEMARTLIDYAIGSNMYVAYIMSNAETRVRDWLVKNYER